METVKKTVIGVYLTDTEVSKLETLAKLSGFSKSFSASTLLRIGIKHLNTKDNPFRNQMLELLAKAEAVELAK